MSTVACEPTRTGPTVRAAGSRFGLTHAGASFLASGKQNHEGRKRAAAPGARMRRGCDDYQRRAADKPAVAGRREVPLMIAVVTPSRARIGANTSMVVSRPTLVAVTPARVDTSPCPT